MISLHQVQRFDMYFCIIACQSTNDSNVLVMHHPSNMVSILGKGEELKDGMDYKDSTRCFASLHLLAAMINIWCNVLSLLPMYFSSVACETKVTSSKMTWSFISFWWYPTFCLWMWSVSYLSMHEEPDVNELLAYHFLSLLGLCCLKTSQNKSRLKILWLTMLMSSVLEFPTTRSPKFFTYVDETPHRLSWMSPAMLLLSKDKDCLPACSDFPQERCHRWQQTVSTSFHALLSQQHNQQLLSAAQTNSSPASSGLIEKIFSHLQHHLSAADVVWIVLLST